jgi:outer membrane protein TolC
MIRFILVGLLIVSGLAVAQVPEKWFVAALARSDGFAIALSEAQNAKLRLQRLKSDPLVTKPLLLESSTALESADARVVAARLEVRRGLFQDVFTWSGALDAFELASVRLDFAETTAKAAGARFKTGAITIIEVNRAEADLRSAQSELISAQAELNGTIDVLHDRLGFVPDAKTPSDVTPRPSKQALESNLESNVRLVDAKGALARAKLDLEIKDNEFSAAVEVSEARRVVVNAERNLADLRSATKAALITRWELYQSVVAALVARERAVQLARDEVRTQVERLEQGLVSKLVVLQARVLLVQQQASLEQGRQRFALAVLELAVLVNLDVWAK